MYKAESSLCYGVVW